MNVFELVKDRITVPEAAAYYGLEPSRNGMARCPFHPDRHPSMKLNDRHFFCFGCGASGDVVDLVSRLLDLNPMSAAQRLYYDFGLDSQPAQKAEVTCREPTFREQERRCFLALRDYLLLLRSWKEKDAPETVDGPFTDRFCEACQMEVIVEDLLEALLFEPAEVQRRKVEELRSIVPELEDYVRRKKEEDYEAEGIGA